MNVKAKLKLDEEFIAHLIAWPRFIVGASLLALFTLTLFITSIMAGFGLKLITALHQALRGQSRGTLLRDK